jgi:hypothetical protein
VRLRLLVLLSSAALAAPVAAAAVNPSALPLGDGHVGSQPARGSVDACPLPSLPGSPGGGGAVSNALDAQKRDAVAHEVQDACGGHPGPNGAYHYHAVSSCIRTSGSSTLVGYALDGFGIYVEPGATDADLDACHGRTSTVLWNGKPARM